MFKAALDHLNYSTEIDMIIEVAKKHGAAMFKSDNFYDINYIKLFDEI